MEKNSAKETKQLGSIDSKSLHLSEELSPNWLQTMGTLLFLNLPHKNKQIRTNITNKLADLDLHVFQIVRSIFTQHLLFWAK